MRKNRRYILLAVGIVGATALAAIGPSGAMPDDGAALHQALADLKKDRLQEAENLAMRLATEGEKPYPRAWAVVAAARQRHGQYASAVRAYRLLLGSTNSPQIREYVMAQMAACEAALNPPSAQPYGKRLTASDRAELAQVQEQAYTESSEHFVIRAKNSRLAKLLATESEVSLERVCRVIHAGEAYPHSVEINVWADPEEYAGNAKDPRPWACGSFSIYTRDGATVRQIDLTQRDKAGQFSADMLDRVLPHEMCHLILREHFGDATCPLFLNEGLAMLAETEVDNARILLAGTALASKAKIPLESLLVRQGDDLKKPEVFYAEAFSFTAYLHSRLTAEQFRDFLDNIKQGCTVADALQRALYSPHDDKFLAEVASAWEDHAVTQAQYLKALRDAATGRKTPENWNPR